MTLEGSIHELDGVRPGFQVAFLISVENFSLIAWRDSERFRFDKPSQTEGSLLVVIEFCNALAL